MDKLSEDLEQNKWNVTFLLGAGFSTDAGYPVMTSLLDELTGSLAKDSLRWKVVVSAIESLKKSVPTDQLDVEKLMNALSILSDPEIRGLIHPRYSLHSYETTLDWVRIYLKEEFTKCYSEKVGYMEGLLKFLKRGKLDVFTTNYDIGLETFLNSQGVLYTDGFTDRWRPESFSDDSYKIRLYKLHGSALWYYSNKGRYYKIISRNESDPAIELVFGEQLRPLLLYPAMKDESPLPTLYLMNALVNKLSDNANYTILIVIGYRFGDESIKRIILDAMVANEKLYTIIISPHPFAASLNCNQCGIGEEYLEVLERRIIRLPFYTKEILSGLSERTERLAYLLGNLENKEKLEILTGNREISSNDIASLFDEGHFSRALNLLESRPASFDGYKADINVGRLICNSLELKLFRALGGATKSQQKFADVLTEYVKSVIVNPLVSIDPQGSYTATFANGGYRYSYPTLAMNIRQGIEMFDRLYPNFKRLHKEISKIQETYQLFLRRIEKLAKPFKVNNGSITSQEYETVRKVSLNGLTDDERKIKFKRVENGLLEKACSKLVEH